MHNKFETSLVYRRPCFHKKEGTKGGLEKEGKEKVRKGGKEQVHHLLLPTPTTSSKTSHLPKAFRYHADHFGLWILYKLTQALSLKFSFLPLGKKNLRRGDAPIACLCQGPKPHSLDSWLPSPGMNLLGADCWALQTIRP